MNNKIKTAQQDKRRHLF